MKYAASCQCHGTDHKPLTRTEFREITLDRDGHKCVFCGCTENLDAHHIIERRLFDQCGGYHLDNGATVCELHHRLCEQTVISCDQVRDQVGIARTVLPEYMYTDHQYTKWGDVILDNGLRMPGPLFYDQSVQKILAQGQQLDQYTRYVKYPRTYHHPLSESRSSDDKINSNIAALLKDQEIVITVKMDGENFTGYSDYCHARSIDSGNHESRNWAKTFHFQNVAYNLPSTFRYCAENLYAKHSIHYTNLDSYLLGFQIWDRDRCLSWDDTVEWFELLNITPVPVLYRGSYSDQIVAQMFAQAKSQGHEGIVVRQAAEFSYRDFRNSVAKLVRAGFIESGASHWRFRKTVPNQIKDSTN